MPDAYDCLVDCPIANARIACAFWISEGLWEAMGWFAKGRCCGGIPVKTET